MKQPYTIQFDHLANEIVTEAYIFPAFTKGTLPPLKYFTHYAAWDTGSEQTIISPELAEALQLTSIGREPIGGIGGCQEADVYRVAIGLPNGHVLYNLKVCCLPIEHYELLLGMDIIKKCDFAITNQDGRTTFSFQTPSSTTIDFKK